MMIEEMIERIPRLGRQTEDDSTEDLTFDQKKIPFQSRNLQCASPQVSLQMMLEFFPQIKSQKSKKSCLMIPL